MSVRWLCFLVWVLLIGGCSASQQKPIVEQGIIDNRTGSDIYAVELVQLPTRRLLSFSVILADTQASLGIPPTPVIASQSRLRWRESGRSHEVILDLPIGPSQIASPDAKSHVLVYSIFKGGQAEVRWKHVSL